MQPWGCCKTAAVSYTGHRTRGTAWHGTHCPPCGCFWQYVCGFYQSCTSGV